MYNANPKKLSPAIHLFEYRFWWIGTIIIQPDGNYETDETTHTFIDHMEIDDTTHTTNYIFGTMRSVDLTANNFYLWRLEMDCSLYPSGTLVTCSDSIFPCTDASALTI